MKTYNGLPLVEVAVNDELESDLGLSAVAFVDRPAIQVGFQKFRQLVKLAANESRRIVTGPLLIPNQPVHRIDENGEYYLTFPAQVVESIALKYFRQGKIHAVNLMHQTGQLEDGVTLYESFIVDESRGIMAPAGFDNAVQGTWFVSYKVDNPAVWTRIASGEITGFSIEALLTHNWGEAALQNFESQIETMNDDQLLDIMADILHEMRAKLRQQEPATFDCE